MTRNYLWAGLAMLAIVGCGEATPQSEAPPAGAVPATTGEMKADGQAPTGTPPGSPDPAAKPTDGDANKKEGEADKKDDAPKAAAVTLTGDEVAQIKKLPDDEQADALLQKVCPVSFTGEDSAEGHLGAMGKPIKKVVDGKTVFLCCKGCEKDFDADPKAFLAKAEAAMAAK